MPVEIWTNMDLSNVGKLIPANTMKNIGMAYRRYRHDIIMGKRQLHDLSAMTALKPETVSRKAGLHKGGAGRLPKGTTAVQRVLIRRGFIPVGRAKTKQVSQFPDTPLVDTGNMASERALDITARDGFLELRQGITRAAVASYHQEGNPNLPQRVHLSWNEEFYKNQVLPILSAMVEKGLQGRRMKRVA